MLNTHLAKGRSVSPSRLRHRLISAAVCLCLGLGTACSGNPPAENLTNSQLEVRSSTTTTPVTQIPRGLSMYDRYTQVIGQRCNPNREICWE